MAEFPTTTEELEQYISDYMDAHIAERITAITNDAIAQGVKTYMENYGAAMEDNAAGGDVPLVGNDYFTENGGEHMGDTTIPMAVNSNGVPVSYIQARVRALAAAAASLVTGDDLSVPVVEQTSYTATIRPNVLNTWNANTAGSITVSFTAGDTGKVNEYMLCIAVGVSGVSLSLPLGVKWANGEPDLAAGSTYEIIIINHRAMYAEWS